MILLDDPEAFEPAQDEVVAAVGQPLDVGQHAAAADRIDRRPSLVVPVPSRPQQHHPDHAIAGQRVGDHVAVARLEDVQRQEHVGEEDDVGQREQRQQVRHNREMQIAECKLLSYFPTPLGNQHFAICNNQ